jgi:hypothetical protein
VGFPNGPTTGQPPRNRPIECLNVAPLEHFRINEFASKKQEPCLSIRYRPNSKFFFNFHIPKEKSKTSEMSYARYLYGCSMSPGRESVEEDDTMEGGEKDS